MSRLDAVHAGHADVEQDDVGLMFADLCQRLVAVRREPGKLVAVDVIQQLPESLARRLLVVDDEDLHASPSSTGKRSVTA